MSIKSLLPISVLATAAYAQLNQLAVAKGLTYFGSATDNGELDDTAYTAILSNTSEFGQITPGNSMKWDATEPEQNTFTFTAGDVIADLAANNSQYLRCHNLVWYSQLPSWVTSGTWTNETLTAAMKNHITNEVTHYQGKCLQWDVVNEALNDDGSYRENIFYTTIGETYIDIAFQTAYAADSSAKLYYNDYNIEYGGAKSTAALALVKRLLAADVPIHGVGFQGHFEVGNTPDATDLASNLAGYTALGVEVAYTEVDVRFTSLPPTDAGLAQQSTDYASVATACLNTDGCVGITVWDFDDAYSWVPSTFSGQGDADLFNSSLVRKSAYYGVVAALSSASDVATSSTASATTSSTTSSSSVVVSSAVSTPATSSVITTSALSSSTVSTSGAISTSSSLSVAASSTFAATSTIKSASSTFITSVASAAPTSTDDDFCEE